MITIIIWNTIVKSHFEFALNASQLVTKITELGSTDCFKI